VADNKTEQPGRFMHYRVMTDADGRPVKLGEGAMGVTYLAEDTNLRVKVALKVIAPNLLGDTEIVQRFQREAQAAARLRHPNVAAVYHLGTVDDTFFYTMEFVEGRTLREHVAETGPLPVDQALDVTLQICEALGAAEKHHMVHRDIKPANIMLETTDDGLHAKLIDFGLAKPLQHDAQQTSALLTQRGTFLGTAVFASPEQVQDLPLDTRSDFYALGLTLWVMLEGRPPFEGSLHKVLYDQVHSKPPLDRLLWVPAEVRELLSRMLEKQPSARPQTARELRQMIQDCLRSTAATSSSNADWQRRFRVREAPKSQPWAMTYEGEDSLSGAVWLHFLRGDGFGPVETLNTMISAVRRATEIHHPNVLRHFSVFPASDPQGATGWMVVTEHPGQHTLLSHLQQVKQLNAAEAIPLLERLAEALDCCLASDLQSAELDAARIYLKPQSPTSGSGPVEVVPKLIPIDYRASSTRSGEDTALGLTQIVPRQESRNAADAVHRLATLAYQCLGGAWGRMPRYIPLPGITQHQNETLREALTTRKFTRGADFVDALRETKKPRRTTTTPPTVEEATVTLSPWERLAALASPQTGEADFTNESTQPQAPAPTRAPTPSSEDPTIRMGAIAPASVETETPEEEAYVSVSKAASASTPAPPQTAAEPSTPEPAMPPADTMREPPEPPAETPPTSRDLPAVSEKPTTSLPEAPPETDPAPAAPPVEATSAASAVRTSATELPLAGHPSHSARSSAIDALRQTVEREWRDAKPILDKVATPVKQTVSTLPRWAFITFGVFAAVVGAALWMIANRPVSIVPPSDVEPATKPEITGTEDTGGKSKPTLTPAPPAAASLDQLLDRGTDAANRGSAADLLPIWKDMHSRFPEPKWNSLAKSAGFIAAVTQAWQQDRLGEPSEATHDFLPILALAAKNNDLAILRKLSIDLGADAAAAQPYELALLNALSEDRAKSEMLLDESLRLVQTRKTGAIAERGRDLIRQKLEPLVAFRERWKRPDDMDTALKNAIAELGPKLEALAATDEPAALYLYADRLRGEGRIADSLKQFEKAAQKDHAPSMLQAGLLLSNSKDRAKDLPRAATWFKLADSKQYTQATFALGECYLDGKGMPRDYDLAFQKLQAAADKDIAEAHFLLGDTYLGHAPASQQAGDNFDPAKLNPSLKGDDRLVKAREHFERALRFGFAPAGGPLAGMLIMGEGGARDLSRGIQLLDAATKMESPDPVLLRNYAYLLMPELLEGVPVTREELKAANVTPDAKRAEQLMRQAARLKDEPAQAWCRANGVTF